MTPTPKTLASAVRALNLTRQSWEAEEPQRAPECEVIEYGEEEGQSVWADSVFVQDFTDEVLSTSPAPLGSDA